MANIKITELKKSLKEFDQKELIQLIAELYKLNTDVKDYLSSKFVGEEAIHDLFKKTKKKIQDEFFPERGFGKMRLSEAKNAITNFKKVTSDYIKTVDLMLYYVEIGTEFTNSYGDIDGKFYDSMVSMYNKVVIECEKDEELFTIFRDRLYSVVEESDGIGWGYHDDLCDIYYSIEWLTDDE
jgi:3-methyladenine DNA glycosylase AlkD